MLTSKIETKLPKTNHVSQKKLVSSSQPPSISKGKPNNNGWNLGPPRVTLATRMENKKKNGALLTRSMDILMTNVGSFKTRSLKGRMSSFLSNILLTILT
jgi:hypothetical protein